MSIIQEIAQKNHTWLPKYFAGLDLALLLLLTAYILAGINLVPFHGDEPTYILLSEDYDRIVKQQDLKRVLFNPAGNTKQYLRLTTGSILTYTIGLARDFTNNDDPMTKWFWGSSWDENILQGNLPAPRLLYLARACSALMGALGVVLFFLSARQLFASRLVAWTATLVLATQGSVLVNIRRAMQEGPKFLFLILTLYIASHILKDFQRIEARRHLYVFLGIASGLTLAAKQDTVPMLVAIYAALALIPILQKEPVRIILINVLYLGAAASLAYAFFLALMPVFWGWWESVAALTGFVIILFQIPILRTGRIAKPLAAIGCILILGMMIISPVLLSKLLTPVTSMIQTRETIIGSPIGNSLDIKKAKKRFTFLLENTIRSKVMYMEASSFDVQPYHEQIAAYESSLISGRIGSVLADSIVAILVVIGGWSLLRHVNAGTLFIYSLLIISGILLFAMSPLAWQRYYLIMQIPYSLMAGVGANQIWILGRKLFLKNFMKKNY